MRNNQRGIGVIGIIIILAVIGIAAYFAYPYIKYVSDQILQTNYTPDSGVPQAKIEDIAPGIPSSEKTEVMTMQPDSTYESFLVPNGNVDDFIKTLPADVRVISKKPVQ